MQRYTLKPGTWYACELIGDEFGEDKCSYSPIKIQRVQPGKSGNRRLHLHFHHANYSEGVRDKVYELTTVERGASFLLAKSATHEPPRYLQIYDITPEWVARHFPQHRPDEDIQGWLERHA
ncbi:hypothetical protein [Symmachiella dynata]|uniref:hypothetical protein n=1 Tax=Symmachiella dynata TaxID=2527995 RepID=UPI0030ECE135|tara:strand:+ start:822 stop:1184 length:363 start_codon:yes stop_codon:yes gene_type:complete